MAFPSITERYGSLSATGLAKESSFGTPVAANTFLPMTSNGLEPDPGWFTPHVMQGVRDLQVYNLYGEAKYHGSIGGPLFPSNAMELLVASIGADATAANGVTGSTPTSSTTLASPITSGTNTFSLTSATGYAIGSIIQVDVNNSVGPTTSEVRKIATLVGTNGTVDSNWGFNHAGGAAVSVVVAPFTHTITQANTLPSLTVEKNLGGFQSLQFAGCRVNKFDLKMPVGDNPADITADLMGQSVLPLTTPTAVTITNELPFVFAEATLTPFGASRSDVSNVSISIENGLKETWTYSGQHGPSFITPVTLHVMGTFDAVWSSLNDSTYGDYTKLVNGTLGSLTFTLAHPSSGGSITITMPQIVYSKYGNDVKIDDIISTALTFEASRPLSGSSQYTIQAQVVNSVYLPY